MSESGPWDFLSARVVMVSRYEERDGITRYAEQLMAAKHEGHTYLRIGIPEGPGDYSRALHAGPRALWLLRDARRGDDIVIQYHPHYYIRGGWLSRCASYASWGVLGLVRSVTVVAHEPDPRLPAAAGRRDRPAFAIEERVRGWAWRRQRRLVFHSDWERERHGRRYGFGDRQEQVVVSHDEFLQTAVSATPAEARARLGLPADRVILLLIGFFSVVDPDKGYDRAIAAVRALGDPQIDLHIVGSPIRTGPEIDAHVEDLRAAAAGSTQIHLHEGYVDDVTFDLWLRAADAVLTPYRTSSSSAVVARAQVVGTPVITSDAGGLAEQAGPHDSVVRDDDELREAIRRVSARELGIHRGAQPGP